MENDKLPFDENLKWQQYLQQVVKETNELKTERILAQVKQDNQDMLMKQTIMTQALNLTDRTLNGADEKDKIWEKYDYFYKKLTGQPTDDK